MSIIQGTSKAAGGAVYPIDQSIRFNDGDSPYLNRTFGTPTSSSQFGCSFWVKLGADYDGKYIISANGGGNNDNFTFSSGQIIIQEGGVLRLRSTQLFRDFSSWYHFVVAYDLGNATASQKLRVYLNGSEITSWSTDTRSSLSSTSSRLNAAVSHDVGANVFNGVSSHINNWDGYIAEFHFVDGAVLTPTDFGEYNDAGVWIPIEASPTYGNNGFYITGATASDLGEDFSGNNNDFTSSGLATTDQMLDTPTLNFCTLNPNDKHGSGLTLSDGNLRAVPAAAAYGNNHGTFYVNSGKWVFEVKHTTVFGEACGWSPMGERIAGSAHRGYLMFADGRAYINTSNQGTKGASLASGDYRYIFYDADLEAMWFAHVDVSSSNALVYDNSATKAEIEAGTTTNAVFTSIQDVDFAPGVWMDTSGVIEVNFGQSAFITSSDLPNGFNALSTANLVTPSITDGSAYFNPVLFTGNSGTAFSVTGVGFQPDFVWGKPRSYADNHRLMDVVRGSTKQLISNATNAEFTQAQGITSFDSDGFTVGTHNGLNTGTNTYVGWCWLADNTTGSSNTDGSINTTATSVNTTAGFSISKYDGSGSNATVGHGLGIAPKMVIVKEMTDSRSWVVYHEGIGDAAKVFYLNQTAAAGTDATVWNSTAPTSTVFSVGTANGSNGSGNTYIAYAFAEIPGYSSIGSYTGNGSATDGPFVYTGFKPAFVMFKVSSNAPTGWAIIDNKRSNPFNPTDGLLQPDQSGAEGTTDKWDILSNGFKVRTTWPAVNGNGYTVTYMAFAEHPFGGDGVAPATAR